MSTQDSGREIARAQFVKRSLDIEPDALVAASADAGFRSYWRVTQGEKSWVLMDSPPQLEDVRPWLHVRKILLQGGVRVPTVLFEDSEQGFVLLEDLGAQTCLQQIGEQSADATYLSAIEQLLRIQKIPPPANMPRYDEALLAREMDLFDQWYVQKHLGVSLNCDDTERMQAGFRLLMNSALAQSSVFVHRDFMLRNLMPTQSEPCVLDFQDAVVGPISYDPISLVKDAFVSWPEEQAKHWLHRYYERAKSEHLPVGEWREFERAADWMGIQRHLKVIGIFARLNYRDHKPKYLQDTPRFFAYLNQSLPGYPQLDGLYRLISELQARSAR